MKPVKKVVRKATGGAVPKTMPTKKPAKVDKVSSAKKVANSIQELSGPSGGKKFASPEAIERRIEHSYESPSDYVSHADDSVLREIVADSGGKGARGRSASNELAHRDDRWSKYGPNFTKVGVTPRTGAPEKKSSLQSKYAVGTPAVAVKRGGLLPKPKPTKSAKPVKVATKPTVRRTGRGK
jgi:hypothetical protein